MLIAFCIIAGTAYADGTDCAKPIVLAPCPMEDSPTCYWYDQNNAFVDVGGVMYAWDGTAD